MAWLRWRSKSSSSAGRWTWTHFKGHLDDKGKMSSALKSAVESFLEDQQEQNSWSEHYRGIEWRVHDDGYAPRWVIDQQINELVTGQERALERYTVQLQMLSVEQLCSWPCPQCEGADTAVETFRAPTELCPRCGRSVVGGTLPYYLMPTMMPGWDDEEADALKLLRSLCAKRRFSNRGAELCKKTEARAWQILIDRGLATGSYGPGNKSEMGPTPKGAIECAKHAKPKAKCVGRNPKKLRKC